MYASVYIPRFSVFLDQPKSIFLSQAVRLHINCITRHINFTGGVLHGFAGSPDSPCR